MISLQLKYFVKLILMVEATALHRRSYDAPIFIERRGGEDLYGFEGLTFYKLGNGISHGEAI